MELFEVFIKIAINAEEINKKLDDMMDKLGRFVKACDEMAEKCNRALNRMYDGFMRWAGRLAAVNTYVKFFEHVGEGWSKLTKKSEDGVSALQSIGGAFGTAYDGLEKFGKAAAEIGGGIYEFLTRNLIDAGLWIIRVGNSAIDAGVQFGTYLYGKLKAAGTAVATFSKKLLLLLGPKGLIIAAVAAVVGAVIGWVKSCEDAQEKLRAIWEKIQDAIEPVVNFIKDLVSRVFGWISDFIDEHGETIMATFRIMWDTIKGIFDTVVGAIQTALRIFTAIFQGDWEAAWDEVLKIGERFMGTIENVLSGIVNIGRNLIWLYMYDNMCIIHIELCDFSTANKQKGADAYEGIRKETPGASLLTHEYEPKR